MSAKSPSPASVPAPPEVFMWSEHKFYMHKIIYFNNETWQSQFERPEGVYIEPVGSERSSNFSIPLPAFQYA